VRVLDRQRKYHDAVIALDPFIAAHPSNALFIAYRGYNYSLLRDCEKAMIDFDASIALDPTNPSTYFNRGFCHLLRDRYEPAIADFTRAVTLKADNALALDARAETYATMGEY